MKTQQLKAKILDLLIKGELTAKWRENHKDTESAEVLLEKIRTEKEKKLNDELIAKGKKPTAKVEIKEVADNDKPFEIPASWKWCRLDDIGIIARGGSPRPIKSYLTDSEDGVNWIKIGDTSIGGKYIDSTAQKIKSEGVKHSRLVHKGDFLLTNSMSFGRPYITNVEGCIHDGWLVISPIENLFVADFLYYFLSTQYALKQFSEKATGAVVQNLNIDKVQGAFLPLPPLEEQKELARIAQTLLTMVDAVDSSYTNLEDLSKKTKAKVLDLLTKGELTAKWRESHKDTESAEVLLEKIRSEKEKKHNDELIAKGKKPTAKVEIKEVADSDKPFEIPESWKWCRLEDICFEIRRGKSPTYTDKSNYLVFAQKCNLKQGGIGLYKALFLDESKLSKYTPEDFMKKGDVVINSTGTGTLGRVGFFDEELPEGIIGLVPDGHVTKISPMCGINSFFIYSYLKKKQPEIELLGSGSTNQKELKPQSVKEIYIPLPPLEEQKELTRIAQILLNQIDSLTEMKSASNGVEENE